MAAYFLCNFAQMTRLKLTSFTYLELAIMLCWALLVALLPAIHCGVLAGLIGVWVCVRLVARGLRTDSRGALGVLLGAMAVVGVLLLVNLSFFQSHDGATPENPFLLNFDANLYWTTARACAAGNPPEIFHVTYGILLGFPARFMGLGGLLVLNALMTMLTIVFTGRIVREALGDAPGTERISVIAMLMLACVGNFIITGSILIKDAFVCASFAGCILGLLAVRRSCAQGRAPWAWLVFFTLWLALSAWVRSRSVLMLMPALVLLAPWKNLRTYGGARLALVWLLIAVGAAYGTMDYLTHTDGVADRIMGDGGADVKLAMKTWRVFGESPRGSVLVPFISGYPEYPLWHKVLLLPLTMALQTFLPLPWTFMRHVAYGPGMVVAHFGLFWYIEAAMVLYFFGTGLRRAPRALSLLALSGLAMYAAVAYFFGGTISRYVLPLLPLLLPAAAWTLYTDFRRRSFRVWMAVSIGAIVLALAVGFYLYSLSPAPADEYCLSGIKSVTEWNA